MMAPTWRENKEFWVSYFLIHDQKHIVLDSSEYFKKGLTSAGFEIKNTEHRWGYSWWSIRLNKLNIVIVIKLKEEKYVNSEKKNSKTDVKTQPV